MCYESRLTLQLTCFKKIMARLYIEISGDTLKSKIKILWFEESSLYMAIHLLALLGPT